MKIIFLDIDGVLNSELWSKNPDSHGQEKRNRRWFDPRCVNLLNILVKRTGAKVVLSSTWRNSRSLLELKELFKDMGIECDLIDKTPSLDSPCLRGNEIHQWMSDNKDLLGCKQHLYKEYLILDDDSDMLYWQRNNFFRVDGYVGLTPNLIHRAINFLGKSDNQ